MTAVTEKLEGAVGDEREFKTWGLSVRDITRQDASEENLDDDQGVVATTLNPGFPAAKADLRGGDVIRSVNGTEVENLDKFAALYEQSVKKKETRVVLGVQSGRSRRTVVLKITFDSSTTEESK